MIPAVRRLKRVHLIGVSGTGMGALAMLFRQQGLAVSGSDVAFDPPIGPWLEKADVTLLRGYAAANLPAAAGGEGCLVVVGNAIRRDNPEAMAVEQRKLPRTSMSGALRQHFLAGRRALVVAGTHGKTTTSAMCAWLLDQTKKEPGYFIGGLPKNFPSGAAVGRTTKSLLGKGEPAPFVVEGDEYDAVYWDKRPKFFDYVDAAPRPVVILTSCEHDHIDIYPDAASYEAQFVELVRRVPADGLIVADASQEAVRRIVRAEAKAEVAFYALDGDETGDATPTWLGAPVGLAVAAAPDAASEETQSFDLFAGGVAAGRFTLPSPGLHNARNAVAAVAACAHGFGCNPADLRTALASFAGVRRRQELLGMPGGVRVYDDFAHHPTAVDETLRALRRRHPEGELWAVFEPRSATACRSLHQEPYARAFGAADHVLLAPLGRANIPEAERLDLPRLAADLGAGRAVAASDVDSIVRTLSASTRAGDTVAILSNGAFAGLHARLLASLEARATSAAPSSPGKGR